ncbi:transcriptional regulator of RNA polII, SAGA, subunit-domain-containing protein, partial [Pilobolus umbonatus]
MNTTSAPVNTTTSNTNNETVDKTTLSKSHFIYPTPNGRQDVLALKQQLADALGENGPLYWDALRDFVMGKLNRQEFDFYANLYLSRQHAHLHNAFILSTVHNAQTDTPPPSKHRSVGWAKRKRGKDGSITGDGEDEQDPRKRKLKMDVMSLSKSDRERLKALVKFGDKRILQPFVNKLLGVRVSKPPALPFSIDQLPSNFNQEYSKGLMAPLCIDLKELPSPETLHARMTSIALENGLLGGVGEDVVNVMLFAAENYIKSSITSVITKRRANRCIGITMAEKTVDTNDMNIDEDSSMHSMNSHSNNMPSDSINLRDLAFSYLITPYVLVEKPLSAEKLTALMSDSEDEELVDNLSDSSLEEEYV